MRDGCDELWNAWERKYTSAGLIVALQEPIASYLLATMKRVKRLELYWSCISQSYRANLYLLYFTERTD